jgi:hypothetical protein
MLNLLAVVSLLSFAAFWCACVVKGTVRATLFVFPALAAVGWAWRAGAGIVFRDRFNPDGIWGLLASRLHPFPFAPPARELFFQTQPWGLVCSAVLLVVVAAVQSYRLFRREVQVSVPFAIRSLVPPVIAAFLGGLLAPVPYAVVRSVDGQTYSVLLEVGRAIQKMQIDHAKLDAAHPLELTLDDISRTSPVSDRVRRWVDGGVITVTPRVIRGLSWKNGGGHGDRPSFETFNYFTSFRLRNDWSCWIVNTNSFSMGCTSPYGTWGSPTPP